MRTATAAFRAALAASHKLAVRVDVKTGAGSLLTPDGLQVIDGSVTLDQTAAIRGRCELSLTDDGTLGLVPDSATSALAPYGNRLVVSRGVEYPDGTRELITLGTFRIDSVDVADSEGALAMRVSGLDSAAIVVDARFEEPYEVAAGTSIETAITALVSAALPGVVTNYPGSTFTTPALRAEEGADRWEFAQSIARASGLALYFDGDDKLTLTPADGGSTVATLAEGAAGVLLSAERGWKRAGAYNRVIATGENTGEAIPVRGVATDDNPLSPTYYFGPFGKVPLFFASQFIVTAEQAAAAAQSILQRQLGTTQEVSFGTLVDPTLEPGDAVRITRERAGIDEDHIIDALTIPLSAGLPMTGRTRAQEVTS